MRLTNQVCLAAIVVALAFHFQQPGAAPDPDGPIPGRGLRVLIVEETHPNPPYSLGIGNALNSARNGDINVWLEEHCTKDKNGRGAHHVWDKDTPMDTQPKYWQEAMARKRDSLPWIIISNGRKSFEGPVPGSADELLTLLKKYE